jgi:ketosteroid isomerase-like protein
MLTAGTGRRPELSSMADDYARYALSQRAAFEATHPAVLATAGMFADEPVLRVADLGAADGVNSHGLIRELAEERAGRPLLYALVDLPTNTWGVAADHLRRAFGGAANGSGVVVIPASDDDRPGVADDGKGAHYASPEANGDACGRAFEHSPRPAVVISMAGIPLQQAPCLPPGSVHVAVTGTAMHWIADSGGLASTGSVFPGYPDHVDEAERQAWRVAAARQWERLLEMRAMELAPGGRFIAALPASAGPGPEREGPYAELVRTMNQILAEWRSGGRIGAATAAAVVVPVWMRTLDEIRAPFETGGGRIAGLELESTELFCLDNPYWDDNPAVFARRYVRSVSAWGRPLLLRAFAREGYDRAHGLLADFLGELEQRIADAPDRYRWDYIEALVVCRKAAGSGRDTGQAMSQENLALARTVVAAFNRRDVPALAEMVTDDFQWITWTGTVQPTTYHGAEGIASYFRDSDVWEVLNLEVQEYRDLGDEVLVVGMFHARGGGSGVEIHAPYYSAFFMSGGKLARVLSFRTEAEALAAVEQRE